MLAATLHVRNMRQARAQFLAQLPRVTTKFFHVMKVWCSDAAVYDAC